MIVNRPHEYIAIVNSSVILLLLSIIHGFNPGYSEERYSPFDVSAGIASGDVTSNSIIVWSMADAKSTMHIEYSTHSGFLNSTSKSIVVDNKTNYSGHYNLKNLTSDTKYYYKIWFSDLANSSLISKPIIGEFVTAPSKVTNKSISFAVGGDLGGQGFCKRTNIGYSIFEVINQLRPNFFVANGDMIYADDICPKQGPAGIKGWINIPGNFPSITNKSVDWQNKSQVYDIYSKHWEYNRGDSHAQKLYRSIPVYSQTDDHEVADDYSGTAKYYIKEHSNRTGFQNIEYQGLQAFFDYAPIKQLNVEPFRIYRNFSWGSNLDLFLIDAHQYRSSGLISDDIKNNKTLLGQNQLSWLKNSIKQSQATWKVILTDVPITVPHCTPNKNGCDNWATDGKSNETFTLERNNFLRYLDDLNIKNVLFITTDTHYPSNIIVSDDFNSDEDKFTFYELISGPLSASTGAPLELDPTINATYLYKDNGFFNFGYYQVEKMNNQSNFISQIYTSDGLIRPGSILNITAE